jgi:hypothetical protein
MERKKLIIYLILEVLAAFILGTVACADFPGLVHQTIATLLLVSSFVGIFLLLKRDHKHPLHLTADFSISLLSIVINHELIGLVFGWSVCPMV